MAQKEPSQPSARSPLSGCVIMIAALLVVIFLVGYSTLVLFRQADEIEKFTAKAPQPVPTAKVEGNEPAVQDLTARLEKFEAAVKGDEKQEARIALTPDDLNLAIAISPALEQLRGNFYVREIKDGKLTIDINYQMNGRPRKTHGDEKNLVTWDMWYLIATMHCHVTLEKKELVLNIDDLDVPGKTVPKGFMEHFSTLRIFEKAKADSQIGPVMAALTRASLDDDKLTLARVPGEIPPETITQEQLEKGGGKLFGILGIAACAFLIFAVVMIILGMRTQRRQAAAENATESVDSDA